MRSPDGFRRVQFSVVNADHVDYKISCLVCDECQAMVLQNDTMDYAYQHLEWHKKINQEIFGIETELVLVNGEWEERKKQ